MERICDEFSSSAVPSFHSFIVPTFQSSYFTLSRFPISPLNVHALILLKVFLLFQKIEPSPFLSLRMNKKSCQLLAAMKREPNIAMWVPNLLEVIQSMGDLSELS